VNTIDVVGIVIAVVVIAVVVYMSLRIMATRRELQGRYGEEYERVVSDQGGRPQAEAELRRRERRHG